MTEIFRRMYICFGGLKKGFKQGCRPVIGLDGCHRISPGQLLSAVSVDVNNCMFPVAYTVVTWFLKYLKNDLNIGNDSEWTFISDRQKGLINSTKNLLPYAEHRFCLLMWINLTEQWKKSW